MIYSVLIAILAAIFAGIYTGPDLSIGSVTYLQLYTLIGRLFLNALSLVVVPLVAASIITGTARMANDGSFKVLGKRTLLAFISATTIAVLIGYTLGFFVQPGLGETPLISSHPIPAEQKPFDAFSNIFLQVVPQNIFAVASQGQILGVIVFSILFGLSIPSIDKRVGQTLLDVWEAVLQVMMRITRLVMRLLPIGVFGLVAKVVAEAGTDSLQRSGLFLATTLTGLAFYAFIVLPLILRFFGINPYSHLKAMAPAMLTAFTTSSSAATIPVTLECLEKRAGVSSRIASFATPLGCSLNLSGSALFIVLAVMTVAQAYGVVLTLSASLLLILMSIMVATGMAGIPAASIVAVMMILETLGLPAEGIGLLLVVDRIIDMSRTAVTVFGNSCCAAIVDRSVKEEVTA